MDNKISVIVPVYNIAKWLPRCLDSILSQTYQNLEIIVVDDGSKDNSREVMQMYAAKDSRIKAVYKENGGVTSARLRGIEESSGHWIGFVDGDDSIAPEMYQRLLKNALEFDAEISHCGYQMVLPDGRRKMFFNSGTVEVKNSTTALRELLEGELTTSSLCNKLYKNELFRGMNEKMDRSIRQGEDMLMNFFLFSQAKMTVKEDFCFYNYIMREGSASKSGFAEYYLYGPIQAYDRMLECCTDEIRKDILAAKVRRCINNYCEMSAKKLEGYSGEKADFRKRILEQKGDLKLLSNRSRILGLMICFLPGLYARIYPLYCKYFQNNKFA